MITEFRNENYLLLTQAIIRKSVDSYISPARRAVVRPQNAPDRPYPMNGRFAREVPSNCRVNDR